MKKILIVMVAVAGAMMLSAEMPRSEWHAKVGDCALDPAALKATIAQLSSADKAAFLAEVNAAIDKMPGSAEVKASKFLAANRAAVAGAGSADRAAVLAEVYATVPPESLTVINEEFAKSEFARPATMSDEEYTSIVAQTMAKISQRTSSAESGAVRAGFAGLMFVRAAGQSAENAAMNAVVEALPADVQSDAKESWFPSALGRNGASSYDPMLASAQAGEEPNHATVLNLMPPQNIVAMLMDLQDPAAGVTSTSYGNSAYTIATGEDGAGTGISRIPRDRILNSSIPASAITGNPGDRGTIVPNPYYGGRTRGSGTHSTPVVVPSTTPEPGPYWLQGL